MTKYILAIDTSTGPCSVAVWGNERITAYVENIKPVMQSKSIVPMIEDALTQSGITYRDLACVVSTVGPGSFTGIRVGLATARGIAFSAGIPCAGYTTLDVLAHATGSAGRVLAILNAGKGEWYYQEFSGSVPLFAPRVGVLEDAVATTAPITVSGNADISISGFTHCGTTFPRADALAALAANAAANAQELRPYYIREPDAKLPTKIA